MIRLFISLLLASHSFGYASCLTPDIAEVDAPPLDRIHKAPRHNRAREALIESWWNEKCEAFSRQAIKGIRSDNLICRIEGHQSTTIVIGAHYDKVQGGYGVADNWSGIVLLDALIDQYVNQNLEFSIEFVAFAAEEPGMIGSKAYLKHNQRDISAMLNLDTLGLRPLIIAEESDPELICLAEAAAAKLGVAVSVKAWDKITGDHEVFQAKKIASLNLHSVDKGTINRIHHRRDRSGNVNEAYLKDAYRLSAALVDLLANSKQATQKSP